MKNEVEQYLKKIGTTAEVIAAFKAEELPDEFSVDDSAAAFIEKRKQLTLNDSTVQEEMKKKYNSEQFPAIIKPILSKIKSLTGMTTEEVNELVKDGNKYPDVKEVLEKAMLKLKNTSAQGEDEIKAKLFALQGEYDGFKETHTSEMEKLKTGFENERKLAKVNSAFSKEVSKLDLIIPSEAAHTVLSSTLLSKYRFNVTENGLEALTLDGNKPASETGFLSAADLIKNAANEMQIIKKSNGGGGGDEGDKNKKQQQQQHKPKELTGRALEMQQRAEAKEKR